MKVLCFLLSLLLLLACQSQPNTAPSADRTKVTVKQKDKLFWYYTEDSTEEQGRDSIQMYDNNFEKSLSLYTKVDSLYKKTGSFLISIFKLENEKFAVLMDSTTKVYQFRNGHFEKLHEIKVPKNMHFSADVMKKDINLDGYPDVVISSTSGGTYGEDFVLLFFVPDMNTLTYNKKCWLRNVEFITGKKELISMVKFHRYIYTVNGYSIVLREDHHYLSDLGLEQWENYKEIIKYDKEGKVLRRDTVPA